MKGIGSSWQCLQCKIVELFFSSFDIPESKDFVIGKINIQIHEHVREKERETEGERESLLKSILNSRKQSS